MSKKINSFSKETIKIRMQQNAVKIWGLKSVSSLDPFVNLLIDAFATEIFKANNEIQAANSRILEKLAKLLTPSIYTYPQPAHAIAHTFPKGSLKVLPGHSEFIIKQQFPSSVKSVADVQIEIHFTPIDNIRLVKMETALLLSANTCYAYDAELNKIPVSKTPAFAIRHNQLVLGIDASRYKNVELPKQIALYCSNPTFEYIDFVFKLLPFVKITCKDSPLKVKPGLTYEASSFGEGYEELFTEFSIKKQMDDKIKTIYTNKFIEISQFNPDAISTELPASLTFLSKKKELATIVQGKKMIWLEIEFPPQYTADILENFSFSLNAFPVYNRKWKNNEYSLAVIGDNIPLSTDLSEHFLYVDKVLDSEGNKYSEIPFQKDRDVADQGLYTIRKGGMERFNERNALEMIANVLELTRDEVSAFGVLERDKVVEALKDMTKQMRILDQRVTNAERLSIQDINYVIVNPYPQITNLKANYWVTHCSLANNIRSGTVLTQPKMTAIKVSQKLRLLTETTGGTEEQKGTNAIQAYKYALTSRDKLITIEDIKNYCSLTLKDELKNIEVKRGTIISSKPKEGFIRTIEIEIAPTNYAHLGQKYWDDYSLNLKHQIMLRGIDGIEYVVTIKNQDYE